MNLATEPTKQLTQQQQPAYFRLADAALQQYALGPVHLTFLQHNAGIVFRVIVQTTGQQYLLKLHKRVGAGDNPSAEQLELGLCWLAAFAQASDVVTNIPIPTRQGPFVGFVTLTPDTVPIPCTLQQWVEGSVPNGDLTHYQAQQLGKLMASLHAFSRTYPLVDSGAALRHDTHSLAQNIHLLRTALPTTLLSPQDVETISAAGACIAASMTQLGYERDMWGPVHGDLHYDNMLFHENEIRPIDFPGLRLAHYLYDIGVTLYHTFHQGVLIREAFFAGYQQRGTVPSTYQTNIEGFITYAAIDSVAWNSTIAAQLETPLFQRNVHQLVEDYCRPVARGESFLFR